MPSPTRPRPAARWTAWLILLVIAPALILALFELSLRLGGVGWDAAFFIPGPTTQTLSTNRKFGWRYFPRQIARTPIPLVVERTKPAGKRRIVVLGESAAMGFPDPMFSFAHQIQAIRGNAVEVINASMTAIGSAAIRDIAVECARLHPDLVIVYMGNNEVVAPSGAATVLRQFRLGQLLVPQRADLKQWRGMEMFLGQQMEAEDPRLEDIYRAFRANLVAICRTSLSSGAKVILSTVAVNLKDNPPFAGSRAKSAFRSGDFAKARDLDTLRFRADSRINAIIREVGASIPGVRLLDAEKLVSPDATSFYEHVHLRPAANLTLANAMVGGSADNSFQPTPWDEYRMLRDISALMERPPFHGNAALQPQLMEWRGKVNLAASINTYRGWTARFPDDLLIRERYAELLAEAGKFQEASAQWKILTTRLPGIPNWHTGYGESQIALGQLLEAKNAYAQAARIDDRFIAAHIGLGAVESALGHIMEAEVHFREALAIDPFSPEANNNLAGVLVRQNRLTDATPYFAESVRAKPDFANAQYSYAATLARLGRVDEAMNHYRAAIQSNPNFPSAHYDLGLLLAGSGKTDEAISHYQEALRLDPSNADAENNWGTALARSGKLNEAVVHFEAALRLRPGHAQARINLESARRSH